MEREEHWRQRLLELKAALRLTQAAMAAAIGVEPSYVSRLFYSPGKAGRKNLGMTTMRALQEAYGLEPGWFDAPLGSALPPADPTLREAVAREPQPTSSNVVRVAAKPWPFKAVTYKRLASLQAALGPKAGAEALRDLDSLLDIAVSRWEARAGQTKKRRAS